MNTKKIAAILIWLVAFAFPFQSALLSTEEVGNIKGLISFVIMLILLFSGYMLFDSAGAKKSAEHGH